MADVCDDITAEKSFLSLVLGQKSCPQLWEVLEVDLLQRVLDDPDESGEDGVLSLSVVSSQSQGFMLVQ